MERTEGRGEAWDPRGRCVAVPWDVPRRGGVDRNPSRVEGRKRVFTSRALLGPFPPNFAPSPRPGKRCRGVEACCTVRGAPSPPSPDTFHPPPTRSCVEGQRGVFSSRALLHPLPLTSAPRGAPPWAQGRAARLLGQRGAFPGRPLPPPLALALPFPLKFCHRGEPPPRGELRFWGSRGRVGNGVGR